MKKMANEVSIFWFLPPHSQGKKSGKQFWDMYPWNMEMKGQREGLKKWNLKRVQ